jgi:hypothetical protein
MTEPGAKAHMQKEYPALVARSVCKPVKANSSMVRCQHVSGIDIPLRFEGIPLRGIVLYYYEGRLLNLGAHFAPPDNDRARAAAIARLKELQSRAQVSYSMKGDVQVWQGQDEQARLSMFDGGVVLTLTLSDGRAAMARPFADFVPSGSEAGASTN